MSLITTNPNALKLLRVHGTTINHNHCKQSISNNSFTKSSISIIHKNTNNYQSLLPSANDKHGRSSCISHMSLSDVNEKSNYNKNSLKANINCSNSDFQQQNASLSQYIHSIAQMESSPDLESDDNSNDSDEEYYDLFNEQELKTIQNRKKQKSSHIKNSSNREILNSTINTSKKHDVITGIELMLEKLRTQANTIEQARYKKFKNMSKASSASASLMLASISNCPPMNILNRENKEEYLFRDDMNWWDQPFRDHLRSSHRPVVRETGIQQFASEYMLAHLRDQEKKVLYARQKIEIERIRKPKYKWYEMKGVSFGNELRRAKRHLSTKAKP